MARHRKRGRPKGKIFKWGYKKRLLNKFKKHSAKANKYEVLAQKERRKCIQISRHL